MHDQMCVICTSDPDCDEVDLVPVFETEVLDLMSDTITRHQTEGEALKHHNKPVQ